jgi:hypothetical protein
VNVLLAWVNILNIVVDWNTIWNRRLRGSLNLNRSVVLDTSVRSSWLASLSWGISRSSIVNNWLWLVILNTVILSARLVRSDIVWHYLSKRSVILNTRLWGNNIHLLWTLDNLNRNRASQFQRNGSVSVGWANNSCCVDDWHLMEAI